MPLGHSYEDGGESFQPTKYELDRVKDFFRYRGRHHSHADTSSVFLLVPGLTRPALETLKKIEHVRSFRNDLDAGCAVRSLTISRNNDQPVLVLEDPVGELCIA